MAAAEQRRLLEQLMGADALAGTGDARHSMMHYTDPKVCRSFLCGICPHDLFTNTKQDLGPCPKIHSEALRADYQRESSVKNLGYEFEYENDLAKYIDDCQKRIDIAYRRLDRTADEIEQTNTLLQAISDLERTIEISVQEVEMLGELGLVVRATEEHYKVKQIKQEHAQREFELRVIAENGSATQNKLQVCDVCGAYLSKLDNDRRLADHFGGKMHLGYARMRDELKRVKAENRHRKRPSYADVPERRGPRVNRGDDRRRSRGYDRR